MMRKSDNANIGDSAYKKAQRAGTIHRMALGGLLLVGSTLWAFAQPTPPPTEQPPSSTARPEAITPPATDRDNTPNTTHAPVPAPIAPAVTPPTSSNESANAVAIPDNIAGTAQFCLKGNSANANCIFQDRAGCESAKQTVNSSGECVDRAQLIGTTGLGGSGSSAKNPAPSPRN